MGISNWVTGFKTLYRTSTKYNTDIIVTEGKNGVRRVLCGGPTQSISYDSSKVQGLFWGKGMQYIEREQIVPKKILILGFCAGTFAHLLSKRFTNVDITGVEIDKEMVYIGEKYFDTKKIPHLNVEVADAYSFMKKNKIKYDLIIVDTYIGPYFPAKLASTEFIEYIVKGLDENGVCIVNMLNTSETNDMAENYEKYMRRVFLNVEKQDVSGITKSDNVLLIGKVK